MKRRNAETGKVRRSLKRTKISEGMYGSSLLYLKFVMLWATVIMVDYMLEFRFEFLWPIWMMLRSICDSFKYQGISFSVFFICTALTSDVICFFFLPVTWMFVAASTYVWVQCIWYTVAEKGLCLPTVALCCIIAYVESAVRFTDKGGWAAWAAAGSELHKPLAAHCCGFPAVLLGFSLKTYVCEALRARTQRRVRIENDLFFRLMREALPENTHEQNVDSKSPVKDGGVVICNGNGDVNGSAGGRRKSNKADLTPTQEHNHTNVKQLDKLEKVSPTCNGVSGKSTVAVNGTPPLADEHKVNPKSKCDKRENGSATREERKRNKNKDLFDNSHKSTEQVKEQLVKEVESTKDVRNKELNNSLREIDRERREMDRERKERDREKEREQREARECLEELKRVRAELSLARTSEAEARRALAAVEVADKQRRADHQQLRIQHTQLQNKVTMMKNTEDRRRESKKSGDCGQEWCRSRVSSLVQETNTLRREVARARDANNRLQRDLHNHTEQLRSLESRHPTHNGGDIGEVAERWAHLERALSAETRVKLDLLSALGEAKRQLAIREGLITKQEKEIEELKAQMLAVMPSEYISQVGGVPHLRIQTSPLDPNASAYTPKQLCSDA